MTDFGFKPKSSQVMQISLSTRQLVNSFTRQLVYSSTRLLVNLFRIQCPHGVENSDNRDADIGKDSHPHRGYS